MNNGGMELDHDAAVRAAAGLSEVSGAIEAAANALTAAADDLSWGSDEVGAALAARHDTARQAVTRALPAVARSLRTLDTTVQGGAAALTGVDAHNGVSVHDAADGRV